MSLFTPLTFSTDWEVMVLDRLQRLVGTDKLTGIAGMLGAMLDLPIKVDLDTLEFALGVNNSFPQLRDRITHATDRAGELLAAYGLDLFPTAAHPTERLYCGGHVHVGTLADEQSSVGLQDQVLPYLPAFAALAANSPLAHGRRGRCKSYRVRYQANGDISPASWRDPRLSQYVWGADFGPKLESVPTMEVRVPDAASSRRFLTELVVFIAAFLAAQGKRVGAQTAEPVAYRDYLINRWTAARDGLQATFRWRGGARPVVELLEEMLALCAEELPALQATRGDLALLDAMIAKRTCQADFALDIAARYRDPWSLISAYAKRIRQWDAFDDYLASAPPRDPLPPLDDDAVRAVHLQAIGEGTRYVQLREVMSLPPTAVDDIIAQLLRQGTITRDITPQRGIVFSRAPRAVSGEELP